MVVVEGNPRPGGRVYTKRLEVNHNNKQFTKHVFALICYA